jgi:hypothetical protein
MKNQNIRYQTTIPAIVMALTLACLSWLTVQAASAGGGGSQGGSIVGLWDVTYTSGAGNPMSPFETYQQWHSDGLEIETPNFTPGVCMGTWKQTGARTDQLFHVGFTVGNPPGSYRFVLRELNTVSIDGNSFDGTYTQTFYDANGTDLTQYDDKGTVHATRLTVLSLDQF